MMSFCHNWSKHKCKPYKIHYYDRDQETTKEFDYAKQAFDFLEHIVIPNAQMVPDSIETFDFHIYFLEGLSWGQLNFLPVKKKIANELAMKECKKFNAWFKMQSQVKAMSRK